MVYHHGKFLFAETDRIAMRENGTLTWLISDHLGSTSVTADANGNLVSSLRYTAFGEVRAASGAMEQVTATPVSAGKITLSCTGMARGGMTTLWAGLFNRIPSSQIILTHLIGIATRTD